MIRIDLNKVLPFHKSSLANVNPDSSGYYSESCHHSNSILDPSDLHTSHLESSVTDHPNIPESHTGGNVVLIKVEDGTWTRSEN